MRTPTAALWLSLLAASGRMAAPTPIAAQPLPSAVAAYTGQTAPNTGGATYFLLYQPSITRSGDVAFRSELSGAGVTATNNRALFRQSGGGPVALLLRAGDLSPLPGNSWGTSLSDPNAQEVGGAARAGFYWRLADGGAGKDALWTEQAGTVRNIALQGGAAAGIPSATFATLQNIFEQAFDESGQRLFTATVTGGGVTSANDFGLWFDDGAATTLVVREGDDAPGLPAGQKFGNGFFSPPLLGPGGIVTFVAQTSDGVTTKSGIWQWVGGSLVPLALEEQSGPGLVGTERFGGFSPVSGNALGQIAFWGPIENEFGGWIGYGLWISDPSGNLDLVYRRPSGPPGLGLVNPFLLSDDGNVYLITSYAPETGPGIHGIYTIGPGGWAELVRAGDRVAGLPAGLEYSFFDQLVANGYGQIGFRATITGPGVGSSNNKVLVAAGGDLGLRLVARTGDSLEVAPGVVRTLSGLLLTVGVASSPGVMRGFSDDGGMVWIAGTGGISSAILVTQASIPPSVELRGLEAVQVLQDWNGSVPLVQGKSTYVRAHFQSNPTMTVVPLLRARLAGGGPELQLSPLRPLNPGGKASSRVDVAVGRDQILAGALWELPFEWTIAGDVELEVELLGRPLDCLEAAGPTPNDCQLQAHFEALPSLPVKLVSIDFDDGSGLQRVSALQRADLAQRLLSAYPVSHVAWSGSSAKWPFVEANPDTCDAYKWLYGLKILDNCLEWAGCRTLYYGAFLQNTEDGCAAIGGYTATGDLPPSPIAKGRHTHTHEFAHVLGEQHTVDDPPTPLPGGLLKGFCNEKADAGTPPFPYIHEILGNRRPTLGPLASGENAKVYGLDILQRRIVSPTEFFDLMSYCANEPIDLWPSKVRYQSLKSAIEARFPPPPPFAESPAGSGTEALLVQGTIDIQLGSAAFDSFLVATVDALPPAPAPGPYTLRVHRAGGAVEDTAFSPVALEVHGDRPDALPFFHLIATPATVESVELLDGGGVLASRTASANAPSVQLLAPNGGEVLDQPTVEVSWAASDSDGDPLRYAVQFSADGGATWRALQTDWDATTLELARDALAGTADGRFRVQASDGLRTASDDSDGAFTVADNPPLVRIDSPAAGALLYIGQALLLEGSASDPEEGALAGVSLAWTSSLDGVLGAGQRLALPVESLKTGLHLLTLTAQDLAGNIVEATTSFRVEQPTLLFEDDFESGGTTLWQ